MSPSDMVQAVQAAGASVELLGAGKAKICGPIPPEVMEAIKGDRDAFLEAWAQEKRSRYFRTPPWPLPMRREPPRWRPDVYRRVELWIRRQGDDVCLWATLRACAYGEANPEWTPEQSVSAALCDLLHWQMSHHDDPEDQLRTFEQVAEHYRRTDANATKLSHAEPGGSHE